MDAPEPDEDYIAAIIAEAEAEERAETPADDADMLELVDWARIDSHDDDLVEGLVVRGRWLQVVSPAKQGKSSLMMWIALCLSEGRHPWDAHPVDPLTVLYCDGEMGYNDVRSLITDCGQDPAVLKNLHVSVDRARLDTLEGASRLLKRVAQLDAQVVVLDGLNGYISPEASENDSETWRSLYQYSIVPMKDRDIAVLSGDNMGKDASKGSRGSSAKTDKADGVLIVKKTDDGIRLHILVGRAGAYLSDDLDLQAEGFDRSVPIRYWRGLGGWPEGTKECADLLDEIGVPLEEGRRKIQTRLREAITAAEATGADADRYRVRTVTLAAAIRFRHQRPNLRIVPS